MSNTDAIDDFQVEKCLAKSTNREVYLATNRKGHKLVVKKVKGTSATDIQIVNEIDCGLQLRHPGLVTFLGTVEKAMETYLFFEYIESEDLFACMLKDSFTKPFSEKDAKKMCRQIVNGLLYCHSMNWAHHDLKLENVLIDKRKNATLIDFGFAEKKKRGELSMLWCGRCVDASCWRLNHSLCVWLSSHDYVSPEVLTRTPYDPFKADVWSLGKIARASTRPTFSFQQAELPFGFQTRTRALARGKDHPSIVWADHRTPADLSRRSSATRMVADTNFQFLL